EEATGPSFTPAEAKKLAKLIKASDRGKRLDAIHTVAANGDYISTGDCLLPLLESLVPKKKTEEVVKTVMQVIADYVVQGVGDPAKSTEAALSILKEVRKKPGKYKLVEVIGNLILSPDPVNAWNAVRTLRCLVACVGELQAGSSQARQFGPLLLMPGKPVDNLCELLKKHERLRTREELRATDGVEGEMVKGLGEEVAGEFNWAIARQYVLDILHILCENAKDAIDTVVESGAVPFILGMLRYNNMLMTSDFPDQQLLTSILKILFQVAEKSTDAKDVSSGLTALSEGGAWGAVYDTLRGPCIARATELLQAGESKAGVDEVALGNCLDNMARCAEVLRIMAMSGVGLEEEGALEAGITAMSSILGMKGLPREDTAVANLMTGMVKAMGSIACLSEENRVKVCTAGAVPMVLSLMAPETPLDKGVSRSAATNLPMDTAHGRLMRKTAEKCLHHLLVSRVTWLADDCALCNITCPPAQAALAESGTTNSEAEEATELKTGTGRGPYLTVETVVAALSSDSIDVRCRAVRLLSCLASSKANASALGTLVVSPLQKVLAWWLQSKTDKGEHRYLPPVDSGSSGGKIVKGDGLGGKNSTVTLQPKDVEGSGVDHTVDAIDLVNATDISGIRQLEDMDGTRVLEDETLAYTLTVLLEMVATKEACVAIGASGVVELLIKIIESGPCTVDEFFAGNSNIVPFGAAATPSSASTVITSAIMPNTKDKLEQEVCSSGESGLVHTKQKTRDDQRLDNPGSMLNLSNALREDGITTRQHFCWRGRAGCDPETKLFGPLDWDWDFIVDKMQEPVRPGLVIRGAALRLLVGVVDGDKHLMEVAPPKLGGEISAQPSAKLTLNPGGGAQAVLKYGLPMCLDLLSIDMCWESEMDGAKGTGTETLSGIPVAPDEELVHHEIYLECLRLMGSLLQIGNPAREAFLVVADTHRGGWSRLLQCMAGNESPQDGEEGNLLGGEERVKVASKEGAEGRSEGAGITGEYGANAGSLSIKSTKPWVRPTVYCGFNLSNDKLSALRSALPYIRAVSLLLSPLRNPGAPATHLLAALVALRWLCTEGPCECGPQPDLMCDGELPLPLSKEATAGPLVDTLAGVAVGLGALVPLISISGCALAASGQGSLPPETQGLVSECQTLVNHLVMRGQAREQYWGSLPALPETLDVKGSGGKSSSRKPKVRKSCKGRKDEPASETENEHVSNPTLPKFGLQDPNQGPDRGTWARLLNAITNEPRTHMVGTNALLMATSIGLEQEVHSLLAAGADPNIHGSDGRTPLMYALVQGMDGVVQALVGAGADVDAVDCMGDGVIKFAFLSPTRRVMQGVMQQTPHSTQGPGKGTEVVIGVGEDCVVSSRSSSKVGASRPPSRSRSGSVSVSRSRSRSRSGSRSSNAAGSRNGSISAVAGRRRSSLVRAVSFHEEGSPGIPRRRLSRMFSTSALDSAREALQAHRQLPAEPLRTPRGSITVTGDARMIPYILSNGADPNVSDGQGYFPLHIAVIGTTLTVTIMNQQIKIRSSRHKCIVGGTWRQPLGRDSRRNSREIGHCGDISTDSDGGTKEGEDVPPSSIALIKMLVEAGSKPDASIPTGMTALHAAALVGRADLAETLLELGSSPNITDNLGCLPFHYVCLRAAHGFLSLAHKLLELGTGRSLNKGIHTDDRKGRTRQEKLLLDLRDIMHSGLIEATNPSAITRRRATRSELLNHVSAEGLAPIHYLCDGHIASREAAAAILALYGPTPWANSSSQNTSVAGSLSYPDIGVRGEMLHWLLSEAELDPRVRAPRGATAIHLSVQYPDPGYSDLVPALVRADVNVDALDAPPHADAPAGSPPHQMNNFYWVEGNTIGQDTTTQLHFSALHYALRGKAWEAADKLLLAKARVRVEGAVPPCLHVACLAGAPIELVAKLLDETTAEEALGPGIVPATITYTSTDTCGSSCYAASALYLAAQSGSTPLVQLLLNRYYSPLVANEPVTSGKANSNPGAGCTGYNSEEIQKWSRHHSLLDERNPIHAAAAGGHDGVIRELLNWQGGKASMGWINACDTARKTPLHLAVVGGHWAAASLLTSVEGFDSLQAIEEGEGKRTLLQLTEQANMDIVDSGSGEESALSNLRDSNALIMSILEGIQAVDKARAKSAAQEEEGEENDEGRQAERSNSEGEEDDAGGVLSTICHLHPCFAQGVLYSNAKGVYIPE
ncbi:unnamed protein product, partial [Choristocarpus tenellus]